MPSVLLEMVLKQIIDSLGVEGLSPSVVVSLVVSVCLVLHGDEIHFGKDVVKAP
jgi:hypothetical protein